MSKRENGLGRLHLPDERDRNFALSAPAKKPAITSRYWYANGWWGDQGDTSQCVGYAWAHWLEDGPVEQLGVPPVYAPADIYAAAKSLDDWPGTDYEGTTVRAGAKALQAAGFIQEYRWAFDIDSLVAALLTQGPIVMGINWYESMDIPAPSGRVEVSGKVLGGHAILLDGVSTTSKTIRVKNSWGRKWGRAGFLYLDVKDADKLLHDDGEACLAVEIKTGGKK